ncbi:hypothetical protein OPV22_000836 [Ensete ventricosum]|uniref:Uncharacterized protein n=1 Tax=Ensete ventricosum TaxID=4639 RepID=A0AAV8RNW3_ENSVE|nr:hypothetical protein OPV22_000836 [Ensete ventricosum]
MSLPLPACTSSAVIAGDCAREHENLVIELIWCLRYEHLRAVLQEERAATELVDGSDGDEGGRDVDEAADGGGHEGGVAAEADGLKEHGSLEHASVDAGELLEEGDEDDHGELVAVFPLQDVGPGNLHALGLLDGRHQVVVLGLDVVGATDLAEHGLGLLLVAALDEGVGGVGQDEHADGRRDCGQPQVDALTRQLKHTPDADTEKDTAEDGQEDVPGSAVDNGADEEGDAAKEHGPFPPGHPRHRGGKEGQRQRRHVK